MSSGSPCPPSTIASYSTKPVEPNPDIDATYVAWIGEGFTRYGARATRSVRQLERLLQSAADHLNRQNTEQRPLRISPFWWRKTIEQIDSSLARCSTTGARRCIS